MVSSFKTSSDGVGLSENVYPAVIMTVVNPSENDDGGFQKGKSAGHFPLPWR